MTDDQFSSGGSAPPRWRGPLAIVCATLLMALQDALVKLYSADLPLWQLFFLRSLLALPVILLLCGTSAAWRLRAAAGGWALLRSGLLASMYVWFYAALPVLDLSVVAAVYYTGPLLILLLSRLLLRERHGRAQMVAPLVAFAGVLFVLRPGGEAFTPLALVPFASAVSYALAAVTTRGRARDIDAWTLTLSLNIVFAGVGAAGIAVLAVVGPRPEAYPFLLTAWVPVTAELFAVAALLGALTVALHLLLARAYQIGPTAVVAALDYAYLLFAALWTFVLFRGLPDAGTAIGTALIGLAGVWSVMASRPRAL